MEQQQQQQLSHLSQVFGLAYYEHESRAKLMEYILFLFTKAAHAHTHFFWEKFFDCIRFPHT